jgi:chromosome partitioning protein
MSEIIAIVNQKGGVGKTTTAVNTAACLTAEGKKTLLIDADAQGNSTSSLGISKNSVKENFYHFILNSSPLEKVIQESSVPDLYVIPGNRDLLGINQKMVSLEDKNSLLKTILARELTTDKGLDKFEYVIIDSPPNLDTLSINIMTAANWLIIPALPEYLSLEGLADLMDTYRAIKDSLNHQLAILGVLLTRYNETTTLAKEVSKNLRDHLADLVFETVIHQNIKLAEAPSHCKPIITYAPKSSGSQSYQTLTKEIINRIAAKKK